MPATQEPVVTDRLAAIQAEGREARGASRKGASILAGGFLAAGAHGFL
jgi:hypothetical protein